MSDRSRFMASRRSSLPTRARVAGERGNIKEPSVGIERFLRLSADLQHSLSLEQQLTCVLEAAREDVGLDRLHIWAAAPEGDRLIHIAESGASREDGLSLAA